MSSIPIEIRVEIKINKMIFIIIIKVKIGYLTLFSTFWGVGTLHSKPPLMMLVVMPNLFLELIKEGRRKREEGGGRREDRGIMIGEGEREERGERGEKKRDTQPICQKEHHWKKESTCLLLGVSIIIGLMMLLIISIITNNDVMARRLGALSCQPEPQ